MRFNLGVESVFISTKRNFLRRRRLTEDLPIGKHCMLIAAPYVDDETFLKLQISK